MKNELTVSQREFLGDVTKAVVANPFSDEIGDTSIPVQIKLLRVIQERTFTPVRSHETIRFCGRVIAATNMSLDDLRSSGRFRDDFFYRLCSSTIEVPPLQQRIIEAPSELDELTALTVQRIVGHRSPDLAGYVLARLAVSPGPGYAWPGNVRELEQAVRRIILSGTYTGSARQGADIRDRLADAIRSGASSAAALVADYCALLYEREGTYEAVGRITGLDRRTVKKYVQRATGSDAQRDDEDG